MSTLKERLMDLSDLELRDIINSKSDEYTEEALVVIKQILDERGFDFSTQPTKEENSNNVNFNIIYDYFHASRYEIVEEKLSKLFVESEDRLSRYRQAYTSLLKMKPVQGEEIVFTFIGQTSENYAYKYPFDIFGIDIGSGEYFGLELYPWNEWLNFSLLDKTKEFVASSGIDEFVAICLHKMTTFGFTEDEITEAFNNSFEEFEDFDYED